MLVENVESVLRITLKDLIEGCHEIFAEAMGIWNNHTKFKYLFSNSERYLFGLGGMEIDEYSWVAFEIMTYIILTSAFDVCIMFAN